MYYVRADGKTVLREKVSGTDAELSVRPDSGENPEDNRFEACKRRLVVRRMQPIVCDNQELVGREMQRSFERPITFQKPACGKRGPQNGFEPLAIAF